MELDRSQKSVEVFSRAEWQSLVEQGKLDLTPRLSEISYCLLCGYSDKQIAMSLGIKLPTVRTHMGRLFSKLGVQDRKEVPLFFFRLHRTQSGNEKKLEALPS